MKARLYVDIKFSKRATDTESLATALDNVMDVGMAQLSGCWDDYGGKPQVGKFLVLPTKVYVVVNNVEGLVTGVCLKRSLDEAREHAVALATEQCDSPEGEICRALEESAGFTSNNGDIIVTIEECDMP